MKIIPRQNIRQKIADLTNGTIYSVTFTKKDGSIRLMNSIKGTSRGVKGEGLRYDPETKGLIPVYDLQIAKKDPKNPQRAWRMINVNTISRLAVEGEIFEVTD